jgi:hypothetical protein
MALDGEPVTVELVLLCPRCTRLRRAYWLAGLDGKAAPGAESSPDGAGQAGPGLA